MSPDQKQKWYDFLTKNIDLKAELMKSFARGNTLFGKIDVDKAAVSAEKFVTFVGAVTEATDSGDGEAITGGGPEHTDQGGPGPEIHTQAATPAAYDLKWWQASERKKFREGGSLITRKFLDQWFRQQLLMRFGEELRTQYAEPKDRFFTPQLLQDALGFAEKFPEEGGMGGNAYQSWIAQALEDPARPVVPITFLYHRLAHLVISIQRRGTAEYYDFATKLFAKEPLIPRAALTPLGSLGKFSFLYGATFGRSSKLHGQYVVTVRDMHGGGGAVVALLAYNVENNKIADQCGAATLERYEAEKDLPPPSPGAAATVRAGRAVELD